MVRTFEIIAVPPSQAARHLTSPMEWSRLNASSLPSLAPGLRWPPEQPVTRLATSDPAQALVPAGGSPAPDEAGRSCNAEGTRGVPYCRHCAFASACEVTHLHRRMGRIPKTRPKPCEN